MSREQPPEPTDAPDEEPSGPTSEQLYSVLGDRRRRYTVHYLKQRGTDVSVGDLARQVAAWENAKEPDDLTAQERKRVYISLYQSHLPTLDEEGIVVYDADRKTVELAPALVDQTVYLEVVPGGDIPWAVYYLGLATASAALLVVVWMDLYPFNEVPDLLWAALIVLVLAGSAAVHADQSRRRRLGDDGPPPGWAENVPQPAGGE